MLALPAMKVRVPRLLAQLNGRTAEQDQFEDGTIGENTGGTVIYLTPGVR